MTSKQPKGGNMASMDDIRRANWTWFSPGNRRFFGDKNYWLVYSKVTGERYLLRSTYAWTDMCGGTKTLHYRLNEIEENLKIGNLIDDIFKTKAAAEAWLTTH
jgi:hypothetical protein